MKTLIGAIRASQFLAVLCCFVFIAADVRGEVLCKKTEKDYGVDTFFLLDAFILPLRLFDLRTPVGRENINFINTISEQETLNGIDGFLVNNQNRIIAAEVKIFGKKVLLAPGNIKIDEKTLELFKQRFLK